MMSAHHDHMEVERFEINHDVEGFCQAVEENPFLPIRE
jgi:hypothetical protein